MRHAVDYAPRIRRARIIILPQCFNVDGLRRQVADLELSEVAHEVLVAHPELAVLLEVDAERLLLLVRDVAPLGRPVRPRAVPLRLVAPRVPDPDQRDLARDLRRLDLGLDNLRGNLLSMRLIVRGCVSRIQQII